MGVFSELCLVEDSEEFLEAFGASGGTCVDDLPSEERVFLKRWTTLQMGALLVALRGGGEVLDASCEFELASSQDADCWAFTVPDDLVPRLAALDEAARVALAERLAELTAAELGWTAATHVEVLGGLCALASEAEEDGLDVVFFTSL
ncbi:MAG: hypothetical protein R3B40_28790 [Polyangiales bacterium]|nr:hypothetical protein [Myxococcales bacterium]MCB9656017.1 hypothetical protein [Sandaracinaceae bacterium]